MTRTVATLEVLRDGHVVFRSGAHWLHPLFELEDFLAGADLDPGSLEIRDKIVGRAAALLLARFGVGSVHAGLLSRPGRAVLERWRIPVAADREVDRIACLTEELLASVDDLEEAHRLLSLRAGRDPAAEGG